jgi:hypothetical protein
MNPAYISAVAALAGSIIGGLTSLVTSWLTQRTQARAGELTRNRRRREKLYGRRTEWSDVDRLTLPIALKAVSTMINYNRIGDLSRMYSVTQRAGASFNLAYIGDDFQAEHKEDFDQAYMRALYHYAYEKAEKGYPWQHALPGFVSKRQ